MYVPHNTGKIHLAHKSKYNLTRGKQVILLMITDGEKWHYIAVKSLSGLLRGVTANNNGDFYCLNCFHSYRTKNKFEKHKKICENHDYCHVEMPNENNKIIKYNQGEKSIRSPFIIYADLESLVEKLSTSYNNLEESSTTEINKHTPTGYLLFKYEIINYEKKKLILLTKNEEKNHNKQKVCYICKKEFNTDDSDKKHHKVKDNCHYTGKYRGVAHNICNLRYRIPKEIPIVLHNGSTYDYDFIIKELVKKFMEILNV